MKENNSLGIVNFGGKLWWILISFCRTKLNDELTKHKSVRNIIFLLAICFLIAFLSIKMILPNPLYVVNGIVVSKTEFEKFNPNEIESTIEFKGESAKVIYGENGKNGALLITLKQNQNKKTHEN
jgi:hypothetical protein